MEVKTMEGWRQLRCPIDEYLEIGDAVDEEIYFHFLNILPPMIDGTYLFQLIEPHSDVNGRDTFFTLQKYERGGYWHFKGYCFRGENEAVEPMVREGWGS